VILQNTKSSQKAPLSAALPSRRYHLPPCLERLGSPLNLESVLDQILRPHLGRRPLVVILRILQRRPLDTLRLPRPYRSLNWERLAQHSEPCHTNPCSSQAFKALGSFTLSLHILVKDYEAKKCIGKVNNNLSKCLSCSTSLKACSYHRIRREVLELIMALSPYYLLHRLPHSGAGIGLRRCGI
jgi:hypothetical protein